jgi:23S rRNA (guanosine2251-2'-O)-methyltransferase
MKKKSACELVGILINIRSLYNVGSIFRTSDACGIKKLYLVGFTPTPEHPKLHKTALGAEEKIAWEKVKTVSNTLKQLKKDGYKIIALETGKQILDLYDCQTQGKTAIIVGNEIKGIPKSVLQQCDAILKIPMKGIKESLNVEVAFALGAYQLKYGQGKKMV